MDPADVRVQANETPRAYGRMPTERLTHEGETPDARGWTDFACKGKS